METKNKTTEQRYRLAQKRVEKIKGFYNHLLIFSIINGIIVFLNISNLEAGETYFQWHNFITFSIWGTFLLLHAAFAFIPNIVFGAEWEERKIKKFMDEESRVRD